MISHNINEINFWVPKLLPKNTQSTYLFVAWNNISSKTKKYGLESCKTNKKYRVNNTRLKVGRKALCAWKVVNKYKIKSNQAVFDRLYIIIIDKNKEKIVKRWKNKWKVQASFDFKQLSEKDCLSFKPTHAKYLVYNTLPLL